MSEHDDANRSPVRSNEAQQLRSNNDTLDDAAGSVNNSIIEKVKSRVSSILPNSLSRWFSPSTPKIDSVNGNLNTVARRRRLEEDADEEDDDEDDFDDELEEEDAADDDQQQNTYDENLLEHPPEENSDEESNNSEDEVSPKSSTAQSRRVNMKLMGRNTATKRARFNFDVTDSRDSSITSRQPLVASTPASSSSLRSGGYATSIPTGSSSYRYKHLNLYGGHQSKKPPPYDFHSTTPRSSQNELNNTGDIIDLLPLQETDNNISQSGNLRNIGIGARHTLNMPSTSQVSKDRYTGLANLKRQSLQNAKVDSPCTSSSINYTSNKNSIPSMPRRTSTTLQEMESLGNERQGHITTIAETVEPVPQLETESNRQSELTRFNLQSQLYQESRKAEHLSNGVNDTPQSIGINLVDTGSESSDGGGGGLQNRRKTGLFNMSAMNSCNRSRNSSFGNGLNFFSHLEGHKSLFSGSQGVPGSAFNNSTLSLNSLNRRHFNASLYGSTSALSDSRLLNTNSPFYKGKTAYGGASAYSRYSTYYGTGAGTSISTPLTQVKGSGKAEDAPSNISNTAQRILDLLNKYSTPLTDAKKMGSNLKLNFNQLQPQAKRRLAEPDLTTSRAMRLLRVHTPYSRPSNTLSSNVNGQSNLLPPVKDLQVPSMAQLLHLKNLRKTKTNTVTQKNSSNSQSKSSIDYTLPIQEEDICDEQQQPQQHRHTNKIKTKVITSMRASSSQNANDDAPPPPVNLPNIAFPHMDSVPQIDIALPKSNSAISKGLLPTPNPSGSVGLQKAPALNIFVNSMKVPTPSNAGPTQIKIIMSTSSAITDNFKFSSPLKLQNVNTDERSVVPTGGNFAFSTPTVVPCSGDISSTTSTTVVLPRKHHHQQQPQQQQPQQPQQQLQQSPAKVPQLKTGSVLEALNKPFMSSSGIGDTSKTTIAATPIASSLFGGQFKMGNNEWECDVCMIRNPIKTSKCIACETPRKSAVVSGAGIGAGDASLAATEKPPFALCSPFKKSTGEWECDSCMLFNKQELSKCIACGTSRNGDTAPAASAAATPTIMTKAPIQSTFGDAFKPKPDKWECSTCLVMNRNELSACEACETAKPGSSTTKGTPSAIPIPNASTAFSTFKFGFASSSSAAAAAPATNTTTTTPNTSADVGFTAIATQQKSSKWECEACMTLNDDHRSKCVCCDEPKPGSQKVSDSVPKFSFGATSAAKYKFGFSPADVTTPNSSISTGSAANVATTTVPIGAFNVNNPEQTAKTEIERTGGVIFGGKVNSSTSTGGEFKFGFSSNAATSTPAPAPAPAAAAAAAAVASTPAPAPAPASVPASKANEAATLSSDAKSTGFQFGIARGNETLVPSSTMTAPNFTFGVNAAPAAAAAAAAAAAKTPIEKTASSASNVKFNLPTTMTAATPAPAPAAATATATSIAATTADSTSKTMNFGIGGATDAAKGTGSFLGANTAAPTSSGFSFQAAPLPMTSTGSNAFNFGTTSVTTSATMANVEKSAFSFGSTPTNMTMTTAAKIPDNSTAIKPASTPTAASFFAGNSTTDTSSAQKPSFGTVTNPGTSNLFGTFGNVATNATPISTSIFGSAASNVASPPTTASVAPILGSIGASNTNAKSFFGTAQTPSLAGPSLAAPSIAAPSPNLNHPTTALSGPGTLSGNMMAPQAPKFSFGIPTANNASDIAKPAPFGGGFGATQSTSNIVNATATPPVFGNMTGNASMPNMTFGNGSGSGSGANLSQATSIFGSSALGGAANVFGAPRSENAITPTPVFGSATFGSNAPANATPLAFGNASATSPKTFGSFGSAAGTSDGASAAKKTEASFIFSAAAAAPSTAAPSTSGFNFSAAAATAKPTFNFTATSGQRSFNFTATGSTEQQEQTQQTQQFATRTDNFNYQLGQRSMQVPVFVFGSSQTAAAKGSPKPPFQFSAAPSATTNIFAPPPTTAGQQTGQQARRKIRTPMRRLTPR